MFGGESEPRNRRSPDFETGRRVRGRASRSERDDLDDNKARFAPDGAFSEASGAFSADAVEAALADALTKAAAVGRFDVVGQLARELEARRLARSKIVQLGIVRKRSRDR